MAHGRNFLSANNRGTTQALNACASPLHFKHPVRAESDGNAIDDATFIHPWPHSDHAP